MEEFPWDGHSRLVRCHVSFCSQDSGVAGRHGSPVGVLETHDDGERDGPTLAGLSRCGRNRNAGKDGLGVVRG